MSRTDRVANLKSKLLKNRFILRNGFNFWPPFLFSRIEVVSIDESYKRATIKLNWSRLTKNINGTQFGGSIFAMTDPIYVTLFLALLGENDYYIWDKSVKISFIKPGRGPLFFTAEIDDETLELVKRETASGDKFELELSNYVVDEDGGKIAQVERTIYFRLKPERRR